MPGSYHRAVDHRWLRRAAVFAWCMVGVPVLVEPDFAPWRLAIWVAAYAVFGVVAWCTPRRPHLALLALEAACVTEMVAVRCNGFEGALLVLVAMQLAGSAPAPLAWVWIPGQTLLFAVGVGLHWNPRAALLLVSPYLGLQVLGYVVVRLLGRIDAAGRAEERLRIAGELHDSLGHHLTALSLNLEVAAHSRDRAAPVETARSIVRLLLDEVREVVGALRGSQPIDLPAALRRLAADIPAPRVHLDLAQPLRADPERSHLLLRCAQEMITNAARHARAENLWLEVAERGAVLEIRARDDGAGVPEVRDGQGLRGMRARVERLGGTLSVTTRPGAGFEVVATVPQDRGP
jgi:signal transduction histidine kinase